MTAIDPKVLIKQMNDGATFYNNETKLITNGVLFY